MKNKTITLFVITLLIAITLVSGEPTGTAISFNETDPGLTIQPSNRTDPGGTITTLVLDALQQTNRWKAYVGNVTGSLTLSDSAGNTIFSWSLEASGITGEVYSSRSNNVDWDVIQCAQAGTISSEDTFLGFSGTETYSIVETFNETTHPGFVVGSSVITADTCNATSTYVNDAPESQATATFPMILLDDTTDLVYTTPLNAESLGYDGSSLFDFQMIVPNDPQDTTTYYFYAQIGG